MLSPVGITWLAFNKQEHLREEHCNFHEKNVVGVEKTRVPLRHDFFDVIFKNSNEITYTKGEIA